MDTVLLKIKRQFTHDEAIKVLQTELYKVNFRNGELLSENEELRDKISRQQSELEKAKVELSNPRLKLTKEDLMDERFEQLEKAITSVRKANSRLTKDLNLWRNKYFSIAATPTKSN